MAANSDCADCAPTPNAFVSSEPDSVLAVSVQPTKPHDPMDPTTFVPPGPSAPAVTIEFCDRVRICLIIVNMQKLEFLLFSVPVPLVSFASP